MNRKTGAVDTVLVSAVLSLLALGIVMVYSASAVSAEVHFEDSYYFLKRQMIWTVLALLAMTAAMRVDYHVWQKLAVPILVGTVILLVLVLVPGLGKVVNGARRWLGAGGFYLQPSEIAKLGMAIFAAAYLAGCVGRIKQFWRGLVPILAVLLGIFALILSEPDLGTALAIGAMVFVLLFSGGARTLHLASLGLVGAVGVAVAVWLEPYRMKRILAFLDPWSDPLGSGYHIIQSLYAIGSGGLFGVGLGRSREKFLYLPEPHTDFIFAIIGEELGMIGTLTVILLFFLFAWRGMRTAMHAPDVFGSLLAVGLTSMIVVQAMMNIAVVTASMPVTGIPLPFLSFGGSALIFTMIGVGILLNISRQIRL